MEINKFKANNISNSSENKSEKKKNVKDTCNRKTKGYVRVFRNIIKKKNDLLKKILDNRFKKWKKEAFKGAFIRKTVLIRISVSRDNIFKNRLNPNRLNNKSDARNNRPLSADKNLKYKKREVNKENNNNNIKWKNDSKIKTLETKKEKLEINPIKKIYKNENNSIFKTYNKNVGQNYKTKEILKSSNTNVNNKYNKKSNNKINIYSPNQSNKIGNKTPVPIIYSYEPYKEKNNNKNEKKLINKHKYPYNSFTSPQSKKNQGYSSYTNILSQKRAVINYQTKNNGRLTPYEERKDNINKNNFSELKLLDKNKDLRYTYSGKNRYIPFDNRNKYMNYTEKRDNYMKSKLDKEILKKGITTVIQHYLGVRERLDNYYNYMLN